MWRKKFLFIWLPVFLIFFQGLLVILPKKLDSTTYTSYSQLYNGIYNEIAATNAIFLGILVVSQLLTFYRGYSNNKIFIYHFNLVPVKFKTMYLDNYCQDFHAKYSAYKLRVNYMPIKKKCFYFKSDDKNFFKKFRFFNKYLKIDYHYQMNGHGDTGIIWYLHQGACPKAYFDRNLILVDLSSEDDLLKYNLTEEQKRVTKNVKTLLSIPVYEQDFETGKLKDKILGILNVDSPFPVNKMNQDTLNNIGDDIVKLSPIFSMVS